MKTALSSETLIPSLRTIHFVPICLGVRHFSDLLACLVVRFLVVDLLFCRDTWEVLLPIPHTYHRTIYRLIDAPRRLLQRIHRLVNQDQARVLECAKNEGVFPVPD